ncbi:CheR family methyltransferase [Mucilaginibacter sp.]|uniref:CheR family methyltransferase n=1 Tax=Mucilaginibacter sp. TaxID=1882438 RepID=UPI003B005CA2
MFLITDEQLDALLYDLATLYGYDFSGYSRPMLHRRFNRMFRLKEFSGFEDFRRAISNKPELLNWLVAEITVPVTEMFRDPEFFKVLREMVLPAVANAPLIRIWHAGCSTGEEAYSMAILLKELDLLHKSILYATDINPEVLKKAAAGVYPQNILEKYAENYYAAGGNQSFNDYYTSSYDLVKLNEQLKKKIVFSTHNLVTDASFNHFNLIICRNVIIYFNQQLQNRVLNLFDASLEQQGYLALGTKETLQFTSVNQQYQKPFPKEKIWQKI